MMRAGLIDPSNPLWVAMLTRVDHDFYHLPAYCELAARIDGGEPRALFVEDGDRAMLVPFTARVIPDADGAWDAVSPYGYPGPLVAGAEDSNGFATIALAAASGTLRALGCVSMFLRLHPLLGAVPKVAPSLGLLIQHGETIYIDLRQTLPELWTDTRSGHRSEINKAVKAGHLASVDESFRHANRFVDIYRATMARVGAAPNYLYDLDYMSSLRDSLGERLKLATVEIDGTVAAAGLFVETGSIIQYHLSGTDEAFVRQRPTKLLLHFMRTWAKERGAHTFHLGGGVGNTEDSLFDFKAGFSSARRPFFTLRLVIDPLRYLALSSAAQPALDPENLSGFFPLYRRA